MSGYALLVAGGLLALAALWWLLVETEGVYLGRRMVVWLYDRTAPQYDRIKRFMPEYEQWLLAEPILGHIAPQVNPLILDVATGTARLPIALLENPLFQGRVIGVDLSRAMLARAARKLAGRTNSVNLLWCPAESLPFQDNLFDVVTCLESLEFMADPQQVLREMARVLRPGGLLLVTNRINTRWMPGKIHHDDVVCDWLLAFGIEDLMVELWQVDYHKIWGLKAGDSLPTGTRPLPEILRCPRCGRTTLAATDSGWICDGCHWRVPMGRDGVVELQHAAPTD